MKISTCELYVLLFPNGKRYFGLSKKAKSRWTGHKNTAKRGKSRAPVSLAIRKYGAENVRFKLLVVGALEYIQQLEIAAIAHFESLVSQNGYNVSPGGDISPMLIPSVRVQVSNTLKKRIADDPEYRADTFARLAKMNAPEARAKGRNTIKERGPIPISDETRAKMRASGKLVEHKPEQYIKSTAARKKNGKTWTEEMRRAAGKSQRERVRTEEELARLRSYAEKPYERTVECRAKSSASGKARFKRDGVPPMTEAQLAGFAKGRLPRPCSPEAKINIRVGLLQAGAMKQCGKIPKFHPAYKFGPGSSAGFLF